MDCGGRIGKVSLVNMCILVWRNPVLDLGAVNGGGADECRISGLGLSSSITGIVVVVGCSVIIIIIIIVVMVVDERW